MATSVKTYPDDSVNGAADQTITDLVGLPSIPAGATLNSVVLSFTCNRTGGRADNEIRVRLGSTIHYYIQDLGSNDSRSQDITGIVRNNNGTLTYTDGSTTLNLYAYHQFKLFDNANWKLTNIKITATFTKKCVVTLNPTGGTVSPTSVTYDYEATYGTLPKPTREGYTFSYWSKEDGVRIYSSTKITTDHTLIANWTVNSYAITANSNNDSYGTVSGGGTSNYGSTVTLTATPNTGYKVSDWLKDGISLGVSSNTLQVENKGDATYTAVFELIPPEIKSVQMIYLDKQISETNKVPCGEGFIISVELS